jgi:uncharacterized protein
LANKPPALLFLGLGLLIVLGALGQLTFQVIPGDILQESNINISAYHGMPLSLASFLLIFFRESIYIALVEEMFFRGLMGGWLVRKFGFVLGNSLQAVAFCCHTHYCFLSASASGQS